MKENKIRSVLCQYSNDELCEIYDNLNRWEWDDRLGEAPVNFQHLQCYAEDKRIITRDTYITPVIRKIERKVSEHDLLKHHHIYNLGSSETEFETWWASKESFWKADKTGYSVIASVVASVTTVLLMEIFKFF